MCGGTEAENDFLAAFFSRTLGEWGHLWTPIAAGNDPKSDSPGRAAHWDKKGRGHAGISKSFPKQLLHRQPLFFCWLPRASAGSISLRLIRKSLLSNIRFFQFWFHFLLFSIFLLPPPHSNSLFLTLLFLIRDNFYLSVFHFNLSHARVILGNQNIWIFKVSNK